MEEIVKKKTNGTRNRNAGHQAERDVADAMRIIGFPHAVTSRSESKRRDDAGVDIMNKDERANGRLPYNIQVKNCSTSIAYPKILSRMPQGDECNVIIHNQTVRSTGGRFITKGRFAILNTSEFFAMIKKLNELQQGFDILNCYFDSISDEEQPKVHEQLSKLNL